MEIPGAALRAMAPEVLENMDFSGGWNNRDSPTEVGDNETPDCLNVNFDERGGLVKRLGLARLNPSPLAGAGQESFLWASKGFWVFQIGATLYKTNDWSTITSFATFTTSARAAMCDFLGKLVVVHPVDGVFTYDGTTWTLATAAVRGSAISIWQNKVWVTADIRAGNESIVWWSNAGNPSTWTTASDFNFLREFDDQPCVAFDVGQTMDASGRPGLMVFKAESWYRINNSTTGAYTTMHTKAGAASSRAVVSLAGRSIAFCKHGIYVSDGLAQPEPISQKVQRLFTDDQLDLSQLALVCGGVKNDRVLFSLPRKIGGAGQSSNNFTIEYHPGDGWIAPHSFGIAAFAKGVGKHLYGLSPLNAYMLDVFKGWADEGNAISARYQTAWREPAGGAVCEFVRMRLKGRGAFQLYIKKDFELGQGQLRQVEIVDEAFVWNAPGVLWNTDTMIWGPSSYEGYDHFNALGRARALAYEFKESSALSATGPRLLEDGTSAEVGAFAVYGLETYHVPNVGAP